MNVQSFDLIKAEDLLEAPEYMTRLVDKLNNHLDLVTTALQNNLTFGDNSNSELVTIDVAGDTNTQIRLQEIKGPPQQAILVATDLFDYGHLAWRLDEENLVTIKVKFDTSPTADVEVKVLFLGD